MISAANKFQRRGSARRAALAGLPVWSAGEGRAEVERKKDDRVGGFGASGGWVSVKYVVINALGARETNCSFILAGLNSRVTSSSGTGGLPKYFARINAHLRVKSVCAQHERAAKLGI